MKWVYLALVLQWAFAVGAVYAALTGNWFAFLYAALLWGLATFAHGFVRAAEKERWLR